MLNILNNLPVLQASYLTKKLNIDGKRVSLSIWVGLSSYLVMFQHKILAFLPK